MASSSGGIAGRDADGGAIGNSRIFRKVSAWLSDSNRLRSVSIIGRTIPSEKMSTRWSIGFPSRVSGAT